MKLFCIIPFALLLIHSSAQTTSQDSIIMRQFLPKNSVVDKIFRVDLEGDGVMKQFLPPNSAVKKESKLDLKREDISEIAFSYMVTGPFDEEHNLIVNDSDVFNSGV